MWLLTDTMYVKKSGDHLYTWYENERIMMTTQVEKAYIDEYENMLEEIEKEK